MSEENNISVDQLKQAYAMYAFIHQVLTQSTRYSIEEFDVAKSAIKTVTDTANSLADKIKDLESKHKSEESVNE